MNTPMLLCKRRFLSIISGLFNKHRTCKFLFLGFFKDNLMMKILLTIICCTTYIMIASSALRMCLYIQAYNLTFLRIFVLWVLALLAVILVGIIILIFKNNYSIFRHILRYDHSVLFMLLLAHPDYWIAKYNIIVR